MERQTQAGTAWSRRPPEGEAKRNYRITRAPAKGVLTLTILSHDLVGCYTHYVGGRTRMCPGNGCEVCAANTRPRWHGYLAAVDEAKGDRVIVELPATIADSVGKIFDQARTLKGTRLMLSRTSNRPNARVTAKYSAPISAEAEYPAVADIRPILERMWEVIGTTVITRATPAAPKIHDEGESEVRHA
jgi:hypothetical protein